MRNALTEQRWLRFGLFTACYFAQGVPLGLLSTAIPPFLAELGYGVGDVAAVSTFVSLPWAIKLIGGPFMDRFKFPPMGFRRPWVIGAQAGLTVALAAVALVPLSAEGSLLPLMAAGFAVNAFAATQDVAVDGMAIDVLHFEERGRANAFMGFGQSAGIAAFGALCGYLLAQWGLVAGSIACSVAVGLVFVLVAIVRERPGERLMPWSPGTATERQEVAKRGFLPILKDLRVLLLPMSLLLILVEFISRFRDGMAVATLPVFAVDQLGYSTPEYTSFMGLGGLAAALTGALLGFLIDRHGAKRFLAVALVGSAGTHLAVALLPALWTDSAMVVTLGILILLFTQLIFVATIALFMNLCWPRVAATQFAVYMSLANLSRTAGSGGLALVADWLTYEHQFLIMGGLLFVAAVVLVFFDQDAHNRRIAEFEEPGPATARRRRFTLDRFRFRRRQG